MAATAIIGIIAGVLSAGGAALSYFAKKTLTSRWYLNDFQYNQIVYPAAYKYMLHLLRCLGYHGDDTPRPAYEFYKTLSSDLRLLVVQVVSANIEGAPTTGDIVQGVASSLTSMKLDGTLSIVGAYTGVNFFMNTLNSDTLTGYWLRFYSWFRVKGYIFFGLYVVVLLLVRIIKK